jgi:hypothetical protein
MGYALDTLVQDKELVDPRQMPVRIKVIARLRVFSYVYLLFFFFYVVTAVWIVQKESWF